MPPLLSLRDLSLHLPARTGRGWEPVLRDLTFSLARGEILALVGESGCGKTSIARSLLGLLPPGARLSGALEFCARRGALDLARLTPQARQWTALRGAEIGLIVQQPMHALDPRLRVRTQLVAAARAHAALPRRAALGQALDLLHELGLEDAETCVERYPHQLSGGQLQRVMLALGLVQGPELLIADEPTAALDPLTQADTLALLRRLNTSRGLAILLMTHDLAAAAALADRVAVLLAGRLVELGPTAEVWRRPAHPFTRQLLYGAGPTGDAGAVRTADFATACAFAPACPQRRPNCTERLPELEPCGPDHACRCPYWRETQPAAGAGL